MRPSNDTGEEINMSDRLRVSETAGLLDFLTAKLNGWSRNKIKQRLKAGCVVVNGEAIVKHDHALNVGDDVEVLATARNNTLSVSRLEILYQDSDLVAINKPAGLLSVASTQENKQHALAILRNQLSRSKRSVKLWPVHRLDRDTSGVLLFATSPEIRELVNSRWDRAEKTYLAVVENSPTPGQGTIDELLRMDDKQYKMHVGPHPKGKKAITHYKIIREVKGRSVLEVQIDTGRQHQIRAHLAWLGNPVIGDPRYGTDGPRMGLHALRLTIMLPDTGKLLTFETPAPDDFYGLVGGRVEKI